MSIEERLDLLTKAIEANTAAHVKLAEVALAAAGSKTEAKAAKAEESKATKADEDGGEDDAEAKKKAAAEKRRKAAAAKKKKEAEEAAAAEAAEAVAPEIITDTDTAKVMALVRKFASTDDADERDERKAKIKSAYAHLGMAKLTPDTDTDDAVKLANYVAHWEAGIEVNFEDVDEKIEAAGGEDDDLVG